MIDVVTQSPQRLCLRITDDLKMENARDFFDLFKEQYQETQLEVLIDFARIRFVDSSGIGILLRCAEEVKKRGGVFLICGLNKSMHSVFRLAGLHKIFELLEQNDALARFPELQS
ncbi:MAG: STAS domain-containing protein [Spirochaetia bacterium]|nr:STAS domain-containing protein [Spirochaetia bacterium]